MDISEQTPKYEIVSPPMEAKPNRYPLYRDLTAYSDEYRGKTITVKFIAVLKVSTKLNN